jgi:eukaryotic-like serine/threonine-protein kinase
LFFRRTQLRLRGLDYVERAEIDPLERARIDVFWALATGFGLVDVIVGADFATRHILAALRAGDTYRLVRAFSAEATFTAAGGTRSIARTRLLVDRCKLLAQKSGHPHALGLAEAAEAALSYHVGEWANSREKFRRAERIFRDECSGVAWELANVRHFHLASLCFLGELRRLSERVPALLEEAASRGDLLAQTSIRCGHASTLWLAHDDPDGGRRDVTDAVAHWSRRGFLLQHFYELTSLTQFDLYAGDAKNAWSRIQEKWPALESSLLLRMQRVRLEAWALRARTALAAMRDRDSVAMLRDAEKYAHKIEKENVPWALGFALSTRAALAHTGGNDKQAVELLSRASKAFEHSKMRLHAQATRRRLGRLIGGDHGRALIHAADVFMASEEVQDPARMTEMLLPGFV